jgi:hypothetical protein
VATYKASGLKWGRTHGANLVTATGDPALAATYYDAIRVFQNLGELTGEDFSAEEAAAIKVYRDSYVIPNDGRLPGYWCFTDGLTSHALRTGDAESKRAVLLIRDNASFHVSVPPNYPPLDWTAPSTASREVAYAIIDFLNAEKLGAPRHPLLSRYFEQALGHYDQWFVQNSDTNRQPFMAGITGYALIRYHDQIEKDKRILPALKTGADWLWENAWRPEQGGFYLNPDSKDVGAPDLNMLILPVFAWTYKQGGKPNYRLERALAVFDGGVAGAWLNGPKQFNQSYYRGPEALKWIAVAVPSEIETLKAQLKAAEAKIEKAKEVLK